MQVLTWRNELSVRASNFHRKEDVKKFQFDNDQVFDVDRIDGINYYNIVFNRILKWICVKFVW